MAREHLAQVAVEVWRLGQRLEAADLSRERLGDSLRRLTEALAQAGIRYSDPTGSAYTEGMNAEVIAGDAVGGAAEGLPIVQVLRPAVFVDDVCVVAPQIVVGGS